jgi:rubrerythrin
MKTTFVLSLEEDTAAFLEQMRHRMPNEDPNAYMNKLLRQERDRLGMACKEDAQSPETKQMERFVDNQIPSGG